ncbi:MAG: DNA polymerase III subunit gamma/tau [Patescibacteria group bacterium]
MENLVLYRKYRPQSFSQIVGQQHIVAILKNALAQNKIAHAYLFCGPRGSGKTTIARILSKSSNCVDYKDGACDKCVSCLEFNAGRSLDLIEIDAASNRGIDEIKNLRENVRFGPAQGKYKVYLIDEAHMLTKEAFNAFLKTLEEPPPYAVFILATTEPHRLLPTIISRTQRFDFKRLSINELSERINLVADWEKIKVEPEVVRLIAVEADGSVRDAEGMLGQILATGENPITLEKTETILGLFSARKVKELVDLIVSQNQAGSIKWLNKNLEAGYDVGQLLKSFSHYLRKMILASVSPELMAGIKLELGHDQAILLQEQARQTNAHQLASWIKILGETKQNLDLYPTPGLAVELALISFFPPPQLVRHDSPQVHSGQENKTENIQRPIIAVAQVEMEPIKSKNQNVSLVSPIKIDQIAPSTTPKTGAIDLAAIVARWPEVAQTVRPFNHSLSAFIQGMKLQEVSVTVLTLATKYTFHKDRLSELKNKKIIEDAVEKVFGRKLNLNCVLEK